MANESNMELIRKDVAPLNGEFPGYVKVCNQVTDDFTVRYYRRGEAKKRAKKIAYKIKREMLLQMMIYTVDSD